MSKYITHNEVKEKNIFDESSLKQNKNFDINPKNLKNNSAQSNLNEANYTDYEGNDAGYKLNIRNYSAWVTEKENQIVLTKTIPDTLKTLYSD